MKILARDDQMARDDGNIYASVRISEYLRVYLGCGRSISQGIPHLPNVDWYVGLVWWGWEVCITIECSVFIPDPYRNLDCGLQAGELAFPGSTDDLAGYACVAPRPQVLKEPPGVCRHRVHLEPQAFQIDSGQCFWPENFKLGQNFTRLKVFGSKELTRILIRGLWP